MLMGLQNAPLTHQRHMTAALHEHIGKICHVYLNDIIIWLQNIKEHVKNVETVLQALRDARLYCSPKKTSLFCMELNFLGHHISVHGIEADPGKIEKILNWSVPHSSKEVRTFLRLVCYISAFLPKLAKHTSALTPLMMKDTKLSFPTWTAEHHSAFKAIKTLVTGVNCLTTINHQNMEGQNMEGKNI